MATALDVVLEDKRAQEFWLRRLIAIIIDTLIIWLPIIAISSFAWRIGFLGQVPWVIAGLLTVLYSALFEAELGYTIGKRIMTLEVVSLDGRPYDLQRGLIRNFSKLHPVLLILDLLGGMLAENRTNMRYLDTVVNAEVVDAQVAEWRRSQGLTPPPAGAAPEPGVTVQTEEAAPEPTMPPETEEAPAPEPPTETDELQEVPEEVEPVEEEGKAPGIAPPPVPAYRIEPPEEAPEEEKEEEAPTEEEKDEGASEWEEETPPEEEREA